ncbi:hypothetical protein CGMCC3_g18053 [Colletotrichum fructicola]|nr:uncharacterized protein CGMCC3_g18053 [Colletotrichum fructicola]KAE9565765.1 hypothetical protein CGMCC3_g18053 [Colletotrichum fructicola]
MVYSTRSTQSVYDSDTVNRHVIPCWNASRYGQALQLHFNEPEPVLICRPCGYALKPFGERVSRHLAEKHEVPKPQRRGLSALVKSLQLGDPNDVALRPDGLPPHEALTVTRGHACRRCSYRTASDDLICRHIAKSHGVKGLRKTDGWQRDHIRSGVLLQSWSQNGARGFWIAQPTAAGSTTPRETGTPDADDVPAAQHALLAAAHDAERAHLAGGLRATASATGPVDIAFQTGWMRRTGWDLMFDGARRDFLVKMSELPDAGRHVEDDMPLASPPEDEARLRRIVSAVDGVFNRCEDTIRSMDISMRCWLRSTEPHRPYKAPFELVGRQATTYKYRSLVKRLLCFCIRLWRLPLGTRLSQCRRSLTIAQSRALDALWSDELWNTPRPDEAAAAASPARSGAVLAHGEAADADGRHTTEDGWATDATASPPPFLDWSPAGGYFSSALEDLTLRLLYFLMTEEFEDGQSKSTLLVYFGGVLGLTSDGSGFRRPGNYTASLSAFIYCARLVVVEVLLPWTSHDYVSYPARPRSGQLDILNRVRRETMCLGRKRQSASS